MAEWVYFNGYYTQKANAVLHFTDLSFQRGYGVFDFFRLVENRPLFLEDHLNRFFFSAEGLHLSPPLDKAGVKEAVLLLIEKNQLLNSGIRLSLTGGYSADGFTIGKPNFLITQQPFSIPTAAQVQNGIKLLSYPYQRPLPQIKSIDYLMAIYLQPLRIQQRADDILYCHNGFVTECPRSNFFAVTANDTLVTPAEGILKGITRNKVLELAKKEFRVEERPLSLTEILECHEAFVTSTTKQILPVAEINGKTFLQRRISNRLLQLFRVAL